MFYRSTTIKQGVGIGVFEIVDVIEKEGIVQRLKFHAQLLVKGKTDSQSHKDCNLL